MGMSKEELLARARRDGYIHDEPDKSREILQECDAAPGTELAPIREAEEQEPIQPERKKLRLTAADQQRREQMHQAGASDEQIAKEFGMTLEQVHRWKKNNGLLPKRTRREALPQKEDKPVEVSIPAAVERLERAPKVNEEFEKLFEAPEADRRRRVVAETPAEADLTNWRDLWKQERRLQMELTMENIELRREVERLKNVIVKMTTERMGV